MLQENLQNYVDGNRLPLIREAVLRAKSAYLFNLMTGVKGATNLNLLSTDVEFGDGSTCGWDEAGTSTISARTLTPGHLKVNMSFCEKVLLKTALNHDVKIAANQKNLPFEEDFFKGIGDAIAANLEKALWQGDTSVSNTNANLNKFDGLIKIIGASTPAANLTYAASDSVTTVVNSVYAALPAEVWSKGEVVLYMGEDQYRKYIQELIANGNIVITNAVQDIPFKDSVLIPGTDVRVYGLPGLNGTNRMYASYKDNFVYGVDLTSDAEQYDFWYSQDNREFRLAVEFIAGVQVAYPDMVVAAALQSSQAPEDPSTGDPSTGA